MAKELMPPAAVLAQLSAQPGQIAAMTAGLSESELRTVPEPGEWSCVEILGHLRACGDVWGGYVDRMLNEDHPAFRYLSPRTWIRKTDYNQQDFASSFKAFNGQRDKLLAVLTALKPQAWQRGATVKTANRTYERTVHYYAHNLANHEGIHLPQIAKTVRAVRK